MAGTQLLLAPGGALLKGSGRRHDAVIQQTCHRVQAGHLLQGRVVIELPEEQEGEEHPHYHHPQLEGLEEAARRRVQRTVDWRLYRGRKSEYVAEVLARCRQLRVCTKAMLGPEATTQPLFFCRTCRLVESRGMGICRACYEEHAALAHDTDAAGADEEFICDCPNCPQDD
jgi:hypothetical protein